MADFPPDDDVCGALEAHVRRFFADRHIEAFTWTVGPVLERNPHFRALRVAPERDGGLWTYVSVGGWAATEGAHSGLEFIVCTPYESPSAIELLAMTVHYHWGGRLGLGDTLAIGRPWLPGASCEHLLVSQPYPFGRDVELAHVGDLHVRFLWLLPITASERAFKISDGLEALETRFEAAGLQYWRVDRRSVV